MKDNDTTISELKDEAKNFLEERNWGKHHTLKNLAISISLEANELLENFQWFDTHKDKQAITDELADILIYCIHFANAGDIDISKAIKDKLEKARKKYPADTMKSEEGLDQYDIIKKEYRNK